MRDMRILLYSPLISTWSANTWTMSRTMSRICRTLIYVTLIWHNTTSRMCYGWLRLVGSLKLNVSVAKEPYKRDDILRKRPIILRSLQVVATPYLIHTSAQHDFTYVWPNPHMRKHQILVRAGQDVVWHDSFIYRPCMTWLDISVTWLNMSVTWLSVCVTWLNGSTLYTGHTVWCSYGSLSSL